MRKTFFKMLFRNLWKNKTYSFLNIFGLATGIACAGLIFLWVENEVNYDSVNVKKSRLYEVMNNWPYAGNILTIQSTQGLLAPAIKVEIPGIVNTCRISEARSYLFDLGNTKVYSKGMYVDASMFNMFTLPFAQGNAQSAFKQPYAMVVTETSAKKFFGNYKNIIGKKIRVDNSQDYIVTGVLKDLPQNTTIQFEWIASFDIYARDNPQAVDNWGNMAARTYAELSPGANVANINKQLYNFVAHKEAGNNTHQFLFSMNDWRLYDKFENGKQTGSGRIEYVRMLSIIAWVILIIACINFMNLSTARSEKRAREVGVRKVLGAAKGRLVLQFIGEALFMAMLAAVASILIIIVALPAFNMLVEKELSLFTGLAMHITALLVIAVICGLVAGSYPSLYLSSFNPVSVLKGLKMKSSGAAFIRKGLVVFQFTVSIVFIISTTVIYTQIQHVKTRDLGFNKNNLVEVNTQTDIGTKYSVIRQALIHTGLVESVAIADHSILNGGNSSDNIKWQGKPEGEKILISQRTVSPDYFTATGLQLVEGRTFVPGILPDSMNVIITESFAALLGKGSTIGKTIDASTWNRPNLRVIGVVKDYVYANVYSKPDPVMFFCNNRGNILYIRPKANARTGEALAAISNTMKKYNAAYPFDYRFVDDQFNTMFSTETLMSKLTSVFAILAVIISCLGLFGLAAYTAERRIKEIGIRKVLGASITGLAGLLSKGFLQLVALSCIISFPLAGWIMHNWLQQYTYRITMSWWIFLSAGIAAVLIALITISFQTIKAAVANPVKALKAAP